MTTPEAFCANPRHTLTTITEGDYIRCGDCGGRLRDDDPRLARATNPSQQQHKPPMVAGVTTSSARKPNSPQANTGQRRSTPRQHHRRSRRRRRETHAVLTSTLNPEANR